MHNIISLVLLLLWLWPQVGPGRLDWWYWPGSYNMLFVCFIWWILFPFNLVMVALWWWLGDVVVVMVAGWWTGGDGGWVVVMVAGDGVWGDGGEGGDGVWSEGGDGGGWVIVAFSKCHWHVLGSWNVVPYCFIAIVLVLNVSVWLTVQMLLIMMMVIERNGRVDQVDFAKRLHGWMSAGFKELGDLGE